MGKSKWNSALERLKDFLRRRSHSLQMIDMFISNFFDSLIRFVLEYIVTRRVWDVSIGECVFWVCVSERWYIHYSWDIEMYLGSTNENVVDGDVDKLQNA